MTRLLTTIAMTLSLGAPLGAAEIEANPNDSYSGVSFGHGGKREIRIIAGVHEMQGRVAVCGIVVNEARAGALRNSEGQLTRQLQFRIAGQKLVVAKGEFNRYKSVDAAADGKAGCSVTRTAWQARYAAEQLTMDAVRPTYTD